MSTPDLPRCNLCCERVPTTDFPRLGTVCPACLPLRVAIYRGTHDASDIVFHPDSPCRYFFPFHSREMVTPTRCGYHKIIPPECSLTDGILALTSWYAEKNLEYVEPDEYEYEQ